jgi:hypothetical protein
MDDKRTTDQILAQMLEQAIKDGKINRDINSEIHNLWTAIERLGERLDELEPAKSDD